VAVESDHPLAFAILVNDIPPGGRGAARALQNQIIEACVAYLGGE
jgi:D-alanyl-D-alanine carboxypeptidase